MVSLDANAVRKLMEASGIGPSELARRSGLSRQAIYQMMKPGFQPLVRSVGSVSAALGVSPLGLLVDDDSSRSAEAELSTLVRGARQGNARAFELLPGALVKRRVVPRPVQDSEEPEVHQVLAAASALAYALTGDSHFHVLSRNHGGKARAGSALFFGSELMTPERILAMTPEPMRRHLVFGAFELADFERHM
jgi:transcriptional regulator with XRE-family HTH domain